MQGSLFNQVVDDRSVEEGESVKGIDCGPFQETCTVKVDETSSFMDQPEGAGVSIHKDASEENDFIIQGNDKESSRRPEISLKEKRVKNSKSVI